MKLVCGLGNPGLKYANTRHNVGFAICDKLAAHLGTTFRATRFSAHFAEGRHGAEKVVLLKPQTFMNRSGDSISPAMGFFRAEPGALLVIHDDADLAPGRILLKHGGGTAGHKGLNSLRDRLNTLEFDRLRYGIGRPEDPRFELSDYVLAPFTQAELEMHQAQMDEAVAAIVLWLNEGIDAAMNEINGRM